MTLLPYVVSTSQLKVYWLRYRLGLVSSHQLRQVAEAAIEAGLYSPSLVEAAFDAEERLGAIGPAFEQSLRELNLSVPESKDDCCWALLRYYISLIAAGDVQGLSAVMAVFYQIMEVCKLGERNHDAYDIYPIYDAAYGNGDDHYALDGGLMKIVASCRAWLERHSV